MTVQDLRNLIIECLMESDVPVGGLGSTIKLSGWAFDETPNSALQSELNKIVNKYVRTLDIDVFVYTKHIKLKTLNATKDAPKGSGSSFMREFIKFADDNNLVIVLTPAVKGYGSAGFKKTSSYERLVGFYKRFGFKDRHDKRSYRPDLSDTMFREPTSSSKPLNEFNIKVGKYTYDGFTSTQEDNIKRKINLYHLTDNLARKEAIKKEFETLYQYLVGRNRVLNLINIDQSDYLGLNTPEMDVVYGAVSGIPPESIKDYVEVTKGGGGKNIPSRYKRDSMASNYIQLQTV
jgi:hypothetical protein